MLLSPIHCPACGSDHLKVHTVYTVHQGKKRSIYQCRSCNVYFSETFGTPFARLRTPLSRIQTILDALNEGMGFNAACRVFRVSINTLKDWLMRLSKVKEVLSLYAVCHQFLSQVVEGDELYTKVGSNVPPAESKGWTVVVLDRASRFIWDLRCGAKDRSLFKKAMRRLARLIQNTGDLTLITDGERRYGNILFEICNVVLYTGKLGRPKKTLPKGVRVRLKNKGAQTHKRGRKRPKYEAPCPEHHETASQIARKDIHANHVEAFNSSLRRHLACYRRKTNTYAKKTTMLQLRLDVYYLLHNFIRPHFTTKQVPATAVGILERGLSSQELFAVRCG
jgi:transposase-like protein